MTPQHTGATPAEWEHWSERLGLTADLLPAVMAPDAKPAPGSSLVAGSFAKVPCRLNGDGLVIGIAKWPEKRSTASEVAFWSKQPDYGICLQARDVRAIDVDIDNAPAAVAIKALIVAELGQVLPTRMRASSSRFIAAFRLAGEGPPLRKRVMRTAHGAIEFLGDGNQFVVAGRHKSGDRYEWAGGLPEAIPTIDRQAFERLWQALIDRFALEPPKAAGERERRHAPCLDIADPVTNYLHERGLVTGEGTGGKLHVTCPWEHEHSSDSGPTATVWFPAGSGGYEQGHFKCLHAHCNGRAREHFLDAIGYYLADFDVLPEPIVEAGRVRRKFVAISMGDFVTRPSPEWRIKGVLPQTGLGMIYGAPGAGKSFFALDIAMAIVRGLPWRGHRVRPGRVLYVCAEGAVGFVNRVKAYAQRTGMASADGLRLIDGRPDFVSADSTDADELAATATDVAADVIIVDTLAQAMPGGDENSSTDMGRAIARCQRLRDLSGALVVLVHHAGKDESRGARGWSGLKGAVDVEIAVSRPIPSDPRRVAIVTKQKDGEAGAAYAFQLVPLVLGEDAEGDDVTSCYVEETDAPPIVSRGRAEGRNEALVIGVLANAGKPLSHVELVCAVIRLLPEPETGKRDRRREIVKRALDGLVASGGVSQTGDLLQLADATCHAAPREAKCGSAAQAREDATPPHHPL